MSIDEAIELLKIERICVRHADVCDRECGKCSLVQDTDELLEMYDSVFDWLEELKALKNGLKIKCDNLNEALEKGNKIGYNNAIDDFVKALQEKIEKDLSNPDLALECKKCGIWKNYDIVEIAEQLKEGGNI